MKEKKINERTFEFSLTIINLYKFLIYERKEYVMSKQLLRSGTSIGANTTEAQAAQSRKDFISKMSIASKEARETEYWIKLLKASNYLDKYSNLVEIESEIRAIIKIITKIVKTSSLNNS